MVTYDLAKPDQAFVDLIPEQDHGTVEAVQPVNGDKLVVRITRDARDELHRELPRNLPFRPEG